jgi:uncharacterized protein
MKTNEPLLQSSLYEASVPLSRLRRIALHWGTRLSATIALVVVALIGVQVALRFIVPSAIMEGSRGQTIFEALATFGVLAAVLIVTRFFEQRRLADIGLQARGALSSWLKGAAIGAAYLIVSVGILALFGGYRIHAVAFSGQALAAGFLLHLTVGFFEELLFRGILFRFLEEGFGTWAALLISALFFGASHLGNPGGTLWGAVAIAVEAGLSIGALYIVTRNLWVVMGMHTAWNFVQGNIFGFNVSGSNIENTSLFQPSIQGNVWLTGGAFGIEASVIAVVLGAALAAYLLVRAVRQKQTLRGLLWRGGINAFRTTRAVSEV